MQHEIGIAVAAALIASMISLVLRRTWEQWRKKTTLARDEYRERLTKEGNRYQFLRRYYSPTLRSEGLSAYSAFVDGSRVYCSVAVKSEWIHLAVPVSRISSTLSDSTPWVPPPCVTRVGRDYASILRGMLEEGGAVLKDLPIFRLETIDFQPGHIEARFAHDTFLNYRARHGLVIEELDYALVESKLDDDRLLNSRRKMLPMRECLLPNAASLISFDSRMTPGGVCCLFAMSRSTPDNDYALPIMRRRNLVAIGKGELSLAVQGLHQPLFGRRSEIDVIETVYRELYEEVFRGEDAESGEEITSSDIDECEPIQWLKTHSESVTIEIVCFGVSLVGGNFEFGILFAVHDPVFYETFWNKRHSEPNWEAKFETILSSRSKVQIAELLLKPDWVPEGRMVLVEGLSRLKNLDQDRVVLPHIVTRQT